MAKSLVELAMERRSHEQMETFFDRELRPACFKCGEKLSSKNTSGACREHVHLLKKQER